MVTSKRCFLDQQIFEQVIGAEDREALNFQFIDNDGEQAVVPQRGGTIFC